MTENEWLLAPAKLTLSLKVDGVRSDGFHELSAEMVSIDLADELLVDRSGDWLEVIDFSNVEMERDLGSKGAAMTRRASSYIPQGSERLSSGPDNLVAKALSVVGRRAGVRLFKRIPVGGGLGGGSSDAAAALRWAGCTESSVAADLGSDVPFCLIGGRALVGGKGEEIHPLPYEERSFVLLVPPISVSTPLVYQAWDALPRSRRSSRGESSGNDLTEAALTVEPRLIRWRDLFAALTKRTPVLAGSGSTWFVEGSLSELGLEGRQMVGLDRAVGRLISVKTVPSRWTSPDLKG